MKNPNEPSIFTDSESTTQRSPKAGPTRGELDFKDSHPLSGPRPARQSGILHLNNNRSANPLLLAARSDDDFMGPLQKQS